VFRRKPECCLITKRLEYAQAAIPEYWIVDPRNAIIAVLRLAGTTYEVYGQFGADECAMSVIFPTLSIPVSAVFAAQ